MPIQMVKNISFLEVFLDSYIKTRKRNKVGIRFVQKALALIDQKLNNPCCLDDEAIVQLYTPRENDLTQFVRVFLGTVPKKGNIASLTRSRNKLQRFLDCCIKITPVTPTVGVVNDTTNTFNFTFVEGFPDVEDYEYTLDSGATYAPLTAKPITGITGTKLVGSVGVRVKADGINPPSATLYNATPFTVTPATPSVPVTDDTANTFSWTNSAGFSLATDYEYTVNSGTSYSPVTVKPITGLTGVRAIGTVGVRVKAVSVNPPSATLYNAVAFT